MNRLWGVDSARLESQRMVPAKGTEKRFTIASETDGSRSVLSPGYAEDGDGMAP